MGKNLRALFAAALLLLSLSSIFFSQEPEGNESQIYSLQTNQTETGALFIYSSPSLAAVYLNGEESGATPFALEELAEGNYSILILLEGYEPYEEMAEIRSGQETQINALLLQLPEPPPEQPAVGTLIVDSLPPLAAVYLNWEESGATPFALEELAEGNYSILILLEGYEPYEETAEILAGQETQINAALMQLPEQPLPEQPPEQIATGTLQINSAPIATLYLDGEEKGEAPTTLSGLAEGYYALSLAREGYESYAEIVFVQGGQTTTVGVSLQKLPLQEQAQENLTGGVQIFSTPDRIGIYINGKYSGTTPNYISGMALGIYNLSLSKSGYKKYSSLFQINAYETAFIDASLEPILLEQPTGSLYANSLPFDAEIYIDGALMGKTPRQIPNLPVGKHSLVLSKNGYQSYSADFEILQNSTVRINALLYLKGEILQAGALKIDSGAKSARAYVDGAYRGKTPLLLENIPQGRHIVRLILEGFENYAREVRILEGETAILNALLSQKNKSGFLRIASTPPGADVQVDGIYKGKTPLFINGIFAGEHSIRVSKDGHDAYNGVFLVQEERLTLIELSLFPSTQTDTMGILEISCTPSNPAIYIDGRLAGVALFPINALFAGEHHLTLQKRGYGDYDADFNITQNQATRLKIVLSPV